MIRAILFAAPRRVKSFHRPRIVGVHSPLGALLAAALLAAGCNSKQTDGGPSAADPQGVRNAPGDASPADGKRPEGVASEADARKILEQTMQAYGEASSYADSGSLHVSLEVAGVKRSPSPAPFSVTFVRPNKLRLHQLNATAVCDAEHFWAALTHPQYRREVLSLPAPPKLSLAFIYGDPALADAAEYADGLVPPQLAWLLAETPPIDDLADAKLSRLEDQKLPGDEAVCQRVQIDTAKGAQVLWIDAATHLLRRADLPTQAILENIDPSRGVTGMEVWAEFDGAQFHPKLPPEAFAFEAPRTALLLKRFVATPSESPPSLLGEKLKEFNFVDLEGKPVSSGSLGGKVVVLDFWATWCGPCIRSLPNLEKVYQTYRDDDRIAFLAVSNDQPDTSNRQVAAALEAINVHVPIVRDPNEMSRSVFKIEGFPTTMLIGADGKIQDIEVGANPKLAEILPAKLEALLAGKDLSSEKLERFREIKKKFDAEIADAQVSANFDAHGPETGEIEVPQAQILPASEPTSLKLTKLWTANNIKSPGNLLLLDDGGPGRLLAIENAHGVAELAADGTVAAHHELEIPAEAAIGVLRSGVDGQGKRYFAAFASAQQQVFVFDDAWQPTTAYPAEDKHAGISDAQLADLDGDGELDLQVGYWGSVGVQTASLSGTRLRSNRDFENLLHLVAVGPGADGKSRLLLANGQDSLHWLNADLAHDGDLATPNRAVHTLLVWSRGAEIRQIAALSSLEIGATTALGLAADGREEWSYELPRGVQKRPVETIVAIKSAEAGASDTKEGPAESDSQPAWLFPGADGSLHFLDASGKLIDKFAYGAEISGVAWGELAGRPTLLVATPREITAWGFEKP